MQLYAPVKPVFATTAHAALQIPHGTPPLDSALFQNNSIPADSERRDQLQLAEVSPHLRPKSQVTTHH